MQSLGTQFSGGIDSVRLIVGIDVLDSLLQPKWFYDSVFLSNMINSYKFLSNNYVELQFNN